LMYLMRMHEWTNMKEKSRKNLVRYLGLFSVDGGMLGVRV